MTQVWVFFVGLTLLLLITGFHFGGRLGLFMAFLLSLFFLYLVLKKGLWIFTRHFAYKKASGSDAHGLLNILNDLKYQYGFQEITLFYTLERTSPLVWRESKTHCNILLCEQLAQILTPHEKIILCHLMLSHLENRSAFLSRFFSTVYQSFGYLRFLASPLLSFLAWFSGYTRSNLKADYQAMKNASVSEYDFGYFLNKLHRLDFHSNAKSTGAEYFSILTPTHRTYWHTNGLPSLKQRLVTTMGFCP